MEHRLKQRQPEPRLEVDIPVLLLERHGLEEHLRLVRRIIGPEVILAIACCFRSGSPQPMTGVMTPWAK